MNPPPPKKRASDWGQIDLRTSGRYRARYTVPHTGERITLGTFDRKRDAQAALAAVRADMQRGKWKHPDTHRPEQFGDYARTWIATQLNSAGEPLRPATRAEYERYLDKGLHQFTSKRLDEITPSMVRTWHMKRSQTGKTAAAREARLLRAICNTAIIDELITRNPVDSKLCRSSTGLKHRPPTETELAGILDVFTEQAPELRLAILLAAYGGLRFSEWRGLRRSDLQLADDGRYHIHVTRQVQRTPARLRAQGAPAWTVGEPKSAEGVRVVPLPKWASADIKAHLRDHTRRGDDALLFTAKRGSQYLDTKQFNTPWNAARDRLGLRTKVSHPGQPARYVSAVREHDLRAFAATYYVRAGATLREVQALLGHGSTDAALAYQHAVGDRAGDLVDRMPAPAASTPDRSTVPATKGLQ